MSRVFKQHINQPGITDLGSLQVARLYETYCGVNGRWRDLLPKGHRMPSETTFRDWVNANFSTIHPTLVPAVTAEHIAERLAWASSLLERFGDNPEEVLKHFIFIDGTIFSKKCQSVYAPEQMVIVVDRDRRKRKPRLYSQNPTSKSFEVYQAIALGDSSNPFLFYDYDETRAARPNTDILEYFIQNEVFPLADRIRGRPGMAGARLEIVWDHAKVHTAHRLKDLLEGYNIGIAGLPARCPELNVIETLWHLYKQDLRGRVFENNSYEAFLTCVRAACRSVSQGVIDNLIRSVPRRCRRMQVEGGNVYDYNIYVDGADV